MGRKFGILMIDIKKQAFYGSPFLELKLIFKRFDGR